MLYKYERSVIWNEPKDIKVGYKGKIIWEEPVINCPNIPERVGNFIDVCDENINIIKIYEND